MLLARMRIPVTATFPKVSWVGGKVRKWRIPAGLYNALPYFYASAGLLAMIALRDGVAVFLGLILLSAGGLVGLLRAQHRRGLYQLEKPSDLPNAGKEEAPAGVLVQFLWRNSFECGHPLIDEQHRSLFKIGDGLVNAVLKNKSRNHIEFLLDELTKHIEAHFMTEEAAMARTRFPLSDEHREHHRELLERARALRADYREGKLDVSELVGFVVYDVITEHIVREDLKFALRDTQPAAI